MPSSAITPSTQRHTGAHDATERPAGVPYADVVVSPVLGANCYILISPEGQALVIDPGFDVAQEVTTIVESRGATIVGVVISHGHLDHVADIAPLVRTWGAPVLIGGGDAYRLDNPVSQLPQPFIDMFRASRGEINWQAPGRVRELCDDETIEFGSWHVRSIAAPGHTEGSMLYALDLPASSIELGPGFAAVNEGRVPNKISNASGLLFTGDVLFAGSIGRCDLHGGNEGVMHETLQNVIAVLPEDYAVFPGHGPSSIVAKELASNPHLWSIR